MNKIKKISNRNAKHKIGFFSLIKIVYRVTLVSTKFDLNRGLIASCGNPENPLVANV